MNARTESDRRLVQWILRETGIEVNGWQLERWRQRGLLQPAFHKRPGSTAEYDAEARAQAGLLAELSRDRRRRYNDLALLLFWRGRWVREDALRRAGVAIFDQLDELIGPADSERDLDALSRKATRLAATARRTAVGRWLKRRLRGRSQRPQEELADVLNTLLYALKTGETSEESLADLVQALGMTKLYQPKVGEAGPIVTGDLGELADFLAGATISQVREAFAAATMDDLREARDVIKLILPFYRDLSMLYTRWWGETGDALGFGYLRDLAPDELTLASVLPMYVVKVLPYARSEAGRQFIGNVRELGPHFEEMAQLARSLPDTVVAALRAGDGEPLRGLPTAEQERIRLSAGSVLINGEGLRWST